MTTGDVALKVNDFSVQTSNRQDTLIPQTSTNSVEELIGTGNMYNPVSIYGTGISFHLSKSVTGISGSSTTPMDPIIPKFNGSKTYTVTFIEN